MKSSMFKISIITILVLVLVGISQVTAFNMGSFYPASAPSSDINVIRTQPLNSATSQSISGVFNLGYPEDSSAPGTGGLNIRGGFMTSGIGVSADTKISGKLRVAPIMTGNVTNDVAMVKSITTPNGSSEVPQAVSVSGGHIVYAAKKPATTRVMCTDDAGITAPCRDESAPENIIIEPTGTNAAAARFPTSKNVSVAQSSIQGNTAALWGQIATGGSISNTCHNGSWGTASPFNLSTTAITCP